MCPARPNATFALHYPRIQAIGEKFSADCFTRNKLLLMQFPDLPAPAPVSSISFHFEDVEFDLPDEQILTDWLIAVAQAEGQILGEITYIFCSDEHLRGINVQYLDHDYYTDIITFPYEGAEIQGDMFISSERVADNAEVNSVPFHHELCRVMVHGLLHLLGYGDKTEAEAQTMRSKEDDYLALLPPVS